MSVPYREDADVELVDAERQASTMAVWSAIEADRRALDERTARLRAMRLGLDDDEPA